ncbi:TPA: hypothetical protein R1871_000538 [Klebsiella oxytoca]|nr:hypothetical protein [Klebsiella oxytoca]HEC2043603.1 hypothetical protein [Klebsiella oxytoca]
MDNELTKIYVTKYALSDGPFTVNAEIHYGGSMASYKVNGYRNHAHGKDFWLSESEALADCERRRQAKLKSIDKQKMKLEKMTFTISECKA